MMIDSRTQCEIILNKNTNFWNDQNRDYVAFLLLYSMTEPNEEVNYKIWTIKFSMENEVIYLKQIQSVMSRHYLVWRRYFYK